MESFLIFLFFIIALLLLLSTGLPVAVSMGIIGILGAIFFVSPRILSQFSSIAFTQSTSFVLLAAPLFILMSETLAASPIGDRLFRAGRFWMGQLPGSLAMGTILASTAFSAATGSSVVTSATIGRIAVGEMERNNYSKRLALGAVAAGGTLGILIPPSIPMIIYAVVTETSIGALFMAGIIPGLMLFALLCLNTLLLVKRNPELAPPLQERVPIKERLLSLTSVLPALLLGLLVLGSIYTGVATPSESAAIGAVGAFLIVGFMGFLRGKLQSILGNTLCTTAMFLFLVICGLFASFVLNRLGVPQGMANTLLSLDIPAWAIIIMINVLLLMLGMFLDPMSILVVMVPIFFPTVMAMGYDPIWFGIMLTINVQIGAVTPPVGLNLFVMKSVLPSVDMKDVIVGALWFIVPLAVGLVLVILFPQIALFLPSLMR